MTTHASFTYLETNDPALLAEYFELRHRVYRRHYPDLPEGFGQEDETDRLSRIVLGLAEGRVAGGARLTISTPHHPLQLPLEEGGFVLRDRMQDFALDGRPYAEISRQAVDPEFAKGWTVTRGMGLEMCRIAACHGVDTIFSMCPAGAIRVNRINSRRCGVGFHVYEELPNVFRIPMRLCAYTKILEVFGRFALAA